MRPIFEGELRVVDRWNERYLSFKYPKTVPKSSTRILKPYTAPAITSKDPNKLLGVG